MSAAEYLAYDWRDDLALFPVDGKTPMVPWREQSAPWVEWTGRWPKGAGFGIDCGKSGLVVLDEDEPGAVQRWLGYVPMTYTVRTGKGRHFYFCAPPGVVVRNGVRVAPGVDIRAEGGYVVGAGSMHESGRKYVAENTVVPAPLTDDVLARLNAPREAKPVDPASPEISGSRVDGLARSVLNAPSKQGNAMLNWAAGKAGALMLGRSGTAQEEVREQLVAAFLARPSHSEADRAEAHRTVASGWAWGQSDPDRALREQVALPVGGVTVPPLPPDIEVCQKHRGALMLGCPGCRISSAQIDRFARARAVMLEAQANAPVDTWLPVDLSEAPELKSPSVLRVEPSPDGSGPSFALLRLGSISTVYGPSNSAKTTLVHIGIAQEVRAGNLSLIVDHEMGPSLTRVSLRDLGLSDAEIKDGVLFYDDPEAMDDLYWGRFMETLEDHEKRTGRRLTLGLYDSLSRSMGKVAGVSTNDEVHVNAWYDSLPRRVLKARPDSASVTVDHPGQEDKGRAIGSHAKKAGPDVVIHAAGKVPFDRARNLGHTEIGFDKARAYPLPVGVVLAELLSVPGRQAARLRAMNAPKNGEVMLPLDGVSDAILNGATTDVEIRGLVTETPGQMTGVLCHESGADYQARRRSLARLEAAGEVVRRTGGGLNGKAITWWPVAEPPRESLP